MANPNSALIWLPAITIAGLPVPSTEIVPYNHSKSVACLEGEGIDMSATVERIAAAAERIGYPVFLRTDLGSAKHSGPRAYCAKSAGDLDHCWAMTVEDQEMKHWLSYPPEAFLVRKFLRLYHRFTAFGGLPIAREFRFFASANEVICWHPYWPPDALLGHVLDPDWRGKLEDISKLSGCEHSVLSEMAIQAARSCDGGEWSVDFAIDDGGDGGSSTWQRWQTLSIGRRVP